jgi:hypothetical protein
MTNAAMAKQPNRRKARRPAQRAHGVRPVLEALEERLAPAAGTFLVTNNAASASTPGSFAYELHQAAKATRPRPSPTLPPPP